MRQKRSLWYAAVVSALCICLLSLGACSAVQLEERSFPMLAAVDEVEGQVVFSYGFPALSQKENTDLEEAKVNVPQMAGDSFVDCLLAYEGAMSRKADCSHLKVLVLGKRLVADKELFYEMLDTLKEQELFPRNTYVCVTEDVSALLGTEEQLPQDLGTYLELFLQNHESDRQIRRENLGTLLDEHTNRKKAVELPNLQVEQDAIVLSETVSIDFSE